MAQEGTTPLRLRFEGVSPAQANQLAAELDERLRQITRGQLGTRRLRDREGAQDMGAGLEILVTLLGTPFAIAIANGIREFIAKRGSRIASETESGKVVAAGDAATTLDADALDPPSSNSIPRSEDKPNVTKT